jgi:hypothetical protein
MSGLCLLGVDYFGRDREPKSDAGWSAGQIVLAGLGGVAAVALLGWTIKNREWLAIEARTTGRQARQVAGRAVATIRSAGSERRSLRERVTQERVSAQRGRRIKKLEKELLIAGRNADDARRVAEERASALRALRGA